MQATVRLSITRLGNLQNKGLQERFCARAQIFDKQIAGFAFPTVGKLSARHADREHAEEQAEEQAGPVVDAKGFFVLLPRP